MAENFEIIISTKSLLSNKTLVDFIKKTNIQIDSLKVIENWEYEHERYINPNNIEIINELIDLRKIVIFECHSGITLCGAFISKISDEEYEYSLWFSIKHLTELSTDKITTKNYHIYKTIVEYIKIYFNHDIMNFCAMGVEIYVSDLANLEDRIIHSNGVLRWIIPKKCKLDLNTYIEEVDNNFYLYSIYS